MSGWNGSRGAGAPSKKKETHKTNPSAIKGLIAGLIVVIVGAAAYVMVKPASEPTVSEEPKAPTPAKIVEQQPAVSVAEPVPEEKEDRNSLEWLKKHDKRYFIPEGAVRRPNGRLYTKEGVRILESLPARTIRADQGRKKIFEHQAERDISRLLNIEPGKFFIGNGNYGPKFIESFKASLTSPTLITQDDDDETKELKKQVNEVKADLRERMDAGEDIVQIMKDTEKELRTLATFRQDMMKELTALRLDENVTEQDYADYVTAANKMLADRGLKGVSSPKFVEGQLKYIREVHKAKQAAKAAREAAKAAQQ